MQTDLISLLKVRTQLYKHYNLTDETIDAWPYWQFEEMIKIINEEAEKEKKRQREQEKDQNKSFNPKSYMNNLSSMTNKFKPK